MAKRATPLKDIEPCPSPSSSAEQPQPSSESSSTSSESKSIPSSGTSSKSDAPKTTKRRTRHQWWTAFEDEIVEFCIIPRLRGMMQVGVGSKADLIRQWEASFSFKPSPAQMNDWLEAAGLLDIFDAPKTFRLDAPVPAPTPQFVPPQPPVPAETYDPAGYYRPDPLPPAPRTTPTPPPTPGLPSAQPSVPHPSQIPGYSQLPPNLQRALGNLSERELADPGLVREALNLAAENPGMRPVVPTHVNRPSPYPAPPRTFMGANGPVQMPPGATMPGMAPGSF